MGDLVTLLLQVNVNVMATSEQPSDRGLGF